MFGRIDFLFEVTLTFERLNLVASDNISEEVHPVLCLKGSGAISRMISLS